MYKIIDIKEKDKYLINFSNIKSNFFHQNLNLEEYYNNPLNGLPLYFPINLNNFKKNNYSFKIDRKEFSKKIFITNNLDYVGNRLFFKYGDNFSQKVILKKKYQKLVGLISKHNLFVKKKITKLNYKYNNKVCAFQTRNIPHLGHEAIIDYLLRQFSHVVVNPVVGPKKIGDIKLKSLEKIYLKLINIKFRGRVSFLPIYFNMFYAGPREAIHHAIIRKNFGFKNFIIGRDHAGAENLYKPDQALKYVKKYQKKLQIKVLGIKGAYFCNKCQKAVIKGECSHNNLINISGTSFRKHIKKNKLFKYADLNLQKFIQKTKLSIY